MSKINPLIEVKKHKDYLYVIREKLEDIDPRFHTVYTNLFLLIGSEKALLIDTGAGLFPLKPIIDDLIGDMTLNLINTHCHWDHVGSNYEFDEIMIHEIEEGSISRPTNITNVMDSPKEISKKYEEINYLLPPANSIKTIKDGDIINLGNLEVKIIHTPGHSPGSISLLTDRNELFTGDTAHYGSPFLPKKKLLPEFLSTLSKLIELCENNKSIEIYPSHEEYIVGPKLLYELYEGVKNIENLWDTKTKDNFYRAWIIEDGKFKFVISRI
ncbi:MAG: MBL fold metallo-hydrolase [Candidatus Hermodarchaeota archaeon]